MKDRACTYNTNQRTEHVYGKQHGRGWFTSDRGFAIITRVKVKEVNPHLLAQRSARVRFFLFFPWYDFA